MDFQKAFNTRVLVNFRSWLRLLVAVINLPIYALSCMIPKDKSLWVFCCRQGAAYAENARYVYEYVNHYEHGITPVWLTNNRSVFYTLRQRNFRVAMMYSVHGYWYSMRAGCLFFSNFQKASPDYNSYAVSPRTFKVQLWHGSPIKCIGSYCSTDSVGWTEGLVKRFIFYTFPFYSGRAHCHRLLASSPYVAEIMSRAFAVPIQHVWVANYPKNDAWLRRFDERNEALARSKIIYMPTWRGDHLRIFSKYGFDPVVLNEFLVKKNLEFHIKIHHYSLKLLSDEFGELSDFSNIEIVTTDDVYEILDEYDLLVTDYSSVLFDFILRSRPVVFAPFDLVEYREDGPGFIYDYEDVLVGPVAMSWPELISKISEVVGSGCTLSGQSRLCEKFNTYFDDSGSERVVQNAFSMLGITSNRG